MPVSDLLARRRTRARLERRRQTAGPPTHTAFSASLIAALVLLSGCTASATGGWTYAPEPSPAGSAQAAPSVGVSPSSAASSSPSVPASAAPGASSPGVVLQETAKNIAYSQTSLTASANEPFQIAFDNEDAGISHDIAIYQPGASGQQLFEGAIVTGVTQTTYDIPALPPGTYPFHCIVHPTTMVGTLTVR